MNETQTYNKLSGRRNLYRISQRVNDDYDTYSDAIVAAWTEDEARQIHPSGYDEIDPDRLDRAWAGPEDIDVELIGVAEPDIVGVVCASFHAG